MGFWGFGKKSVGSKTHEELILEGTINPGVVVPDHAKPREVVKAKAQAVLKKSSFRVSSVYDVGGEVMLSGAVESGFLKKRMRTKFGDKDVLIRDIKVKTQSVKELSSGEEGTIFLKGKNIHFLRSGDVLEFK